MSKTLKKIITWSVALLGAVFLLWLLWALVSPKTAPSPIKAVGGLFGSSNSVTFSTGGNSTSTNVVQDGTYAGQAVPTSKIFKIAEGPVIGATFIQTSNPTTTLARYTMADNGHTFDIPLDVPGAIARIVSNTTIPGLATELWLGQGGGMVAQYTEGGTVKTVYVGFPVASSSLAAGQTPPRVHFLPAGITSLAVSPDGQSITYLLQEGVGSGGYVTNTNSFNSKKLFSLPLEELVVSWPSAGILLAQSKSAAGLLGVTFSVSVKTGGTSLLVTAPGLTASANNDFSKVLFQKNEGGGALPASFVHDVQTGRDAPLPFNPFPERCVWNPLNTVVAVCAAPLASVSPDYLDLWHMGLAHSQDGIFSFDVQYGVTSLLALPGSKQGGERADITQVALSQDGKYLLYITRGDRSLWGVRL
ncbi:MAG: hypothetical protein WCI89_00610 [bacterium]